MTVTRKGRALWMVGDGLAELRETSYQVETDTVEIKTLFTGISRGTERLVFDGQVPLGEHTTMRAPFQEGEFTFPVKYGYAAVGQVKYGALAGEAVFALYPHQDHFAVPLSALLPVPDDVPVKRAVLAANMETALNICWDAGIEPGDRVSVIGCGVIGALTAYIAARVIGTSVAAIDVDPTRNTLADALGFGFSNPEKAQDNQDVVIHTSATAAGLTTAMRLAGTETKIIEASWFGSQATEITLGGRFHQRRLQIVGSQVGRIPAYKSARWTFQRRLKKAMSLLADPALDALQTGETAFAEIPSQYGAILNDPATLCHTVRYNN